jgi:hypothetical protein
MKVNLGNVNFDLLVKALDDLGLNPRIQNHMIYFGNGESFNNETKEVRVRQTTDVAQIKRAYSAQVVKTQAKKYGWQLKETSPFEYTILKR